MTLSGNLGFVPLDEVLRLLARAGNAGVVEITNKETSGRIFVTGAGIGLATTFDDHDLKDHLISSGYLSPAEASSTGGQVPFNEDLVGLVREMTVESIYRLDGDSADFQVVRDATSPYASPEPFDLERILDDSRKRSEQWESVTKRVPDLQATMEINRTLAAETVQLDRASWRLLSEIGSGASVKDLAARLGTTRYAVASVVATMVDNELLLFGEGAATETAPIHEEPVEHIADPASSPGDETEQASAPADETEVDPDRSWWDEPEAEQAAGVEDPETEPVAAGTDDVSDDNADADTADDAEDTDAFLEKVFSEVASEPAEEDGHGLMRRRRMGSILRELGEE